MPDSTQPQRPDPSRDGEQIAVGDLPSHGSAAATPEVADSLADEVKGGRIRSDSPPAGPTPIPYPNT